MYYYLASLYSIHPKGLDAAAEEAAKIAAFLMSKFIPVYSPVVHSHPIGKHMGNALNAEFWLEMDLPYMDHAKGLIIAPMEGWQASRGIRFEVEFFHKFRMMEPMLMISAASTLMERLDPERIEWQGAAKDNPLPMEIANAIHRTKV